MFSAASENEVDKAVVSYTGWDAIGSMAIAKQCRPHGRNFRQISGRIPKYLTWGIPSKKSQYVSFILLYVVKIGKNGGDFFGLIR